MTDEEDKNAAIMSQARMVQIAVIMLTAMLFVVIGYLAPAMVAGMMPESSYVEAHQFTAQDVNTNSSSHYVCFDRTTKEQSGQTADIYYELYTIDDQGVRYQLKSSHETRHLTDGRQAVMTQLDLPSELPEGEYQYSAIIEMHLADGRVDRQFNFVSQRFTVKEGHEQTGLQEFSKTCGGETNG